MTTAANIHHQLYKGPKVLTDPGNAGTIRPNKDLQICEMVSTTTETRTLANPTKAGIRFVLRMLTDGGDIVVTAANGLNTALEVSATFADAGDMLSLISVSLTATTYRWQVLDGQVGAAIASATSTATSTSTSTGTATATATSTGTATATSTSTATATATKTSTSTSTATSTTTGTKETATATATATATSTKTSTATATPTSTSTATATSTSTSTATATKTSTATATATATGTQ